MNITEDLFLSVSKLLNIRVTPDNLQSKLKDINGTMAINGKIKTDILFELMGAIAKLEKKIDDINPIV